MLRSLRPRLKTGRNVENTGLPGTRKRLRGPWLKVLP